MGKGCIHFLTYHDGDSPSVSKGCVEREGTNRAGRLRTRVLGPGPSLAQPCAHPPKETQFSLTLRDSLFTLLPCVVVILTPLTVIYLYIHFFIFLCLYPLSFFTPYF